MQNSFQGKKKSVALVLSSGGARGLAHIAVIEELEARGYEITSIAGSSMGAVVGAFYACGKLDVYKEWAMKLDPWSVLKLMDFTISSYGFVRGRKVFKTLESFIPDIDIQDMSIPFVAVATDMHKGKEVAFKKGSMYRALKASASIPTVVTPSQRKGRILVDGGVMTPIPVEFVKRRKKDLLVICNVNGSQAYRKPKGINPPSKAYMDQLKLVKATWDKFFPANGNHGHKKMGYLDIMTKTVDLMQDKLTQLLVDQHKPDLFVEVSRDVGGVFDFHKAEEIMEAGRKEFVKSFDQMQRKKDKKKQEVAALSLTESN
jgi:NTE family protein